MIDTFTLRIFILLLIPVRIFGQTYTTYYTGNISDTITTPAGGVCLMGGASENDEAMKWFLRQSSDGDVLVLRASGADGYNNYMYKQLGVHLNSVETIVCKNKAASDEPYLHQKIKQAEAIWFAGGDQWDYISYWRNTTIDSLINDGIKNRHIAVGGTSAGMAIQGGFYFGARNGTVTSSEALSNPYNSRMNIDSEVFLHNKYLEDVITDTHYDDPDRSGRHFTFLARIMTDWGISAKGIASDAYAAICIDSSGLASCYGDYPKSDETLYFLQTNCEIENNTPEVCISGSPLEWNRSEQAIKVYKVNGTSSGGNKFDLKDWKTGKGGTWENWYVNQGVLYKSPGSQVNCSLSSTAEPGFKNTEIILFPNPLIGNDLQLNFPGIEINRVSILDVTGKSISKIQENTEDHILIDASEFTEGIYLIILEMKAETRQFKFIKY
jgi:cyanophycinase-like exopeptidase